MNLIASTSICIAVALSSLSACSNRSNDNKGQTSRHTCPVTFQADSAYAYVKAQTDCGPRVPGSQGHKACEEYIVDQFKKFGADTVIEQRSATKAFNGDELPINNIMARYNPERNDRVLIVAHYDTRPWADQDSEPANNARPIDGANDGASGVAVMLEMARNIASSRPDIGVDFLAVDAEDYGKSDGWGNADETWCLGTQHWIKNTPYSGADKPRYAIVLDMVGGKDAIFHREYHSMRYAPRVVDKVWGTAASSPYADKFTNQMGGSIIDDHLFINSIGIPAIDIVECNNRSTHGFPPTWHTMNDNIKNIDSTSLKAVGQVVLDVIYAEKAATK